MPIGAASLGVFQTLFIIRPAKLAWSDCLDPSVWFI
jgi:hypothetical protein